MVLGGDERRAVERILGDAWGAAVTLEAAEIVADRQHVVRVAADDGRTAILKRPREADSGGRWGDEPEGLTTEWAALELLGTMPDPVAPRLLGGDPVHRIIVVEDLRPDRLLADSLLGGDTEVARADLVAYAEALAALGSWSRDQAAEHAAARRRRDLDPAARSWWVHKVQRGRDGFLTAVAGLGLPTAGVALEIAEIERILDGGVAPGFVHGDPCPDNVVFVDGRCRLLDFERSSWGSIATDAAYLIAPFPSCWCFATLPTHVAGPALAAYQAGVTSDDDWDRAITAALAGALIVRGDTIARVWNPSDDREDVWGTTTMRPRLQAWLDSFVAAPGAAAFPALTHLADTLADQAQQASHDLLLPTYPAFATPGAPTVAPPPDWP